MAGAANPVMAGFSDTVMAGLDPAIALDWHRF
jgi:hypothetical protein